MSKLKDTKLHTDYNNFSTFDNPDNTNPSGYDEARNNYLANKENAALFNNITSGLTTDSNGNVIQQNITFIHNDSVNLPTIGYGINLESLSYSNIEVIFNFAYNAPLTNTQIAGLNIIKDWKVNGNLSKQQIIDIAQGRSGTISQQQQLQSLSMTHNEAIEY